MFVFVFVFSFPVLTGRLVLLLLSLSLVGNGSPPYILDSLSSRFGHVNGRRGPLMDGIIG
jgi:hypothetical protein